ncbi:MAG: hypothetical protein Q4C49_04895 [Bacillota bacterium]|nr:hypothetical protein [Bacillota bacterium]
MIKTTALIVPLLLFPTSSSTEVYIKEPKTYHISMAEEIDRSQSEVILNEEILDISDSLVFRIDQEGKNTLKYVFKDQEGNVVDKGEKIYILDTKKPQIEVKLDDFTFEETIGVMDELEIQLEIDEENIEKKEVYIDDQLQDELDTYFITKENKNMKVIVKDRAGNQTKVEYPIEIVEDIQIESSNPELYTLEENIEFLSEQDLDAYECLINGQVQDSYSYTFAATNEYDIWIQHKKYPYIIPYKQTIYFTNDPLDFFLEASGTKSNQNISIQSSLLNAYIQDSYGNTYAFEDEIVYEAKEDWNETIQIKGFVQDMFGRQVEKELEIQISTILPKANLQIDGIELKDEEVYMFEKIDSISLQADTKYTEIFLENEQRVEYSSLKDALELMKEGSSLQYEIQLEDEFGNKNSYRYLFSKEYTPKFIQQETVNETRNVVEKRVWSLDRKGKVNLVEEQEDKIWNPLIYLDAAQLIPGNDIEIIFMNVEKVKELYINGIEMDVLTLEKDDFGNWKIKYHLDMHAEEIEIAIKDQQNQWTKKKMSIKKQGITFSWGYFFFPIVILLLVYILFKYA